MKKILFFMTTFWVAVLVGCSGGGDDIPTPEPTPSEPSTITMPSSITSNGVAFTSQAGENSVSFTTNTNWTLSIAEARNGVSWCTPSATSGSKGSSTVKFAVTENTSYDDRSVSVTIKAGTASTTFKITQKCADALLVTTKTFEVGKEGGNMEIEVKANISYQMEIADGAKEWISESSSRALTTKTHVFSIASSEEYEKREGEIYIKSGDKQETVKVYQAGEAILVLSNDNYVVSDAGETISIDVQSNFEYDIQMPDVDWIQEESASRGLSSHTVNFVISPNESYDNRSTEIIFYDKNSSLSNTVYITQAQKDAIILSSKDVNVGASESTVEVKVNTNVDFETNVLDTGWIEEVVSSRGLVEHTKSFRVKENTTNGKRTGKVVFLNSSKGIADTLTIAQAQNNALILSQKKYEVPDAETIINVMYQTNVEVEYSIPDAFIGWIKAVSASRALGEFSQSFVISSNEGYDSREGYILFKDKNSSLNDTVYVTQAQKDAIILSQKEYEITSKGGNIEVSYESNVEITITPTCDWIKVGSTTSRALTASNFILEISENTSSNKRIGTVTISNANGTLSETLSVIQKAKPAGGSIEDFEEEEQEW